jgi:AcrR family transcriptional regulator
MMVVEQVEQVEQVERRRGRPRRAEVDEAILSAALRMLAQHGYGGVTMEGVAAEAGVGKATIYRRWASKAELLVDALRSHDTMVVPLPDTGDVRADVTAILRSVQQAMDGEDGPILAAFAVEKFRHPELRDEFQRVFVAERRAHLRVIVAAAIERGELALDTDVELVIEGGPAILVHRMLIAEAPPEPDLAERIVALLLPAVG